jgi:hypothetical protein
LVFLGDSIRQQLSARFIVFFVEFEPTLFAVRYRHTVTPSHDRTRFVEWCQIVEHFKLERFFDRQSEQNATTVFINAISLGKLIEWETQYDALSTAKKTGPSNASSLNGPYRVIEIVAVYPVSHYATIDDSAAT